MSSCTPFGVFRRFLLTCAALAALVCVLPSQLAAQPVPPAGARIRVSMDSIVPGHWRTGQLLVFNRELLSMVATPGDTLDIPRAAIQRLELSEGRYSNPKGGIILGTLVGAGSMFLIHSTLCTESLQFCRETSAGKMTLIGGATGGLLGALFGTFGKNERWSPVHFERVVQDR